MSDYYATYPTPSCGVGKHHKRMTNGCCSRCKVKIAYEEQRVLQFLIDKGLARSAEQPRSADELEAFRRDNGLTQTIPKWTSPKCRDCDLPLVGLNACDCVEG